MNRTLILFLLCILFIGGCFKGTGDVLVLADGTLFEGVLQEISDGQIIFKDKSITVEGSGRVWLMDGSTLEGTVSLSEGRVTAGTGDASADSVLVILWGDTPVTGSSWDVQAGEGWLDTEMEISSGDMISLSGTGTILTETGLSEPEGQKEFSSSTSLFSGATSGQLVFKVGENGTPVAAGALWTGEAAESGSLMLGINVPLGENGRSEGCYTVHVTSGPGGRNSETTAFYPASSPL
ncbi:hypothetical protein CSA37_04685 [Candidatus Fermentibacteria bacterium]|nr:MAG: hypothetical protein CSA37_04685 [Candidatus Fermentibacteria bacterium]